MKPSKDEVILDAACGTGEITYLFKKEAFNVRGFDFSDFLINKAKSKFPDVDFYIDNLVTLTDTIEKYDKIFINGAIYYLHPKYLGSCLRGLYAALNANGLLYLFDCPDFDKRDKVEGTGIRYLHTYLLQVYQPTLGGFWYKKEWIMDAAVKSNYRKVEFLDLWAYYRSHAILEK